MPPQVRSSIASRRPRVGFLRPSASAPPLPLKNLLSSAQGLAVVEPSLYQEQEKARQAKWMIMEEDLSNLPLLKDRPYFFPFKYLPTELQLMIWSFAATDTASRVVTIYYNDKPKIPRFQSKTGSPAILQVSREARFIGLRTFELLVIDNTFLHTFINWERDTIYIDSLKDKVAIADLEETKSGESRLSQMCRRLAVNIQAEQDYAWRYPQMWAASRDIYFDGLNLSQVESYIGVVTARSRKVQNRTVWFNDRENELLGFTRPQFYGSIVDYFWEKESLNQTPENVTWREPIRKEKLSAKQKLFRKAEKEREARCDEVMLAAYELQTSIAQTS